MSGLCAGGPADVAWHRSRDSEGHLWRPDRGGGAGQRLEGACVGCIRGWYLQGKGRIHTPSFTLQREKERERWSAPSLKPYYCSMHIHTRLHVLRGSKTLKKRLILHHKAWLPITADTDPNFSISSLAFQKTIQWLQMQNKNNTCSILNENYKINRQDHFLKQLSTVSTLDSTGHSCVMFQLRHGHQKTFLTRYVMPEHKVQNCLKCPKSSCQLCCTSNMCLVCFWQMLHQAV